MNKKAPYESRYLRLEIKDNILFAKFSKLKIDLEIAKKIVEERLAYTEGRNYPAFIDSEQVISVDRQAKDYFVTDRSQKGITATAIFGQSFYVNWLANFFINFSNKKTPFSSRFFSDKQKAIKWLKSFTETNKKLPSK
jgi:hypothetical protein